MSGEETFEFAAAVAGVSIGLAAVLILSVLGIVGVWRLFRGASDAAAAASRAALSVEELVRRPGGGTVATGDLGQLRDQAQALIDEQQRLQDMARSMLDSASLGGAAGSAGLDDLEAAITRLDATVGQMAASLANLIQLLERQGRR